MSLHITLTGLPAADVECSHEFCVDSKGIQTHSSFLPETAEIIYGGLASVLIIGALVKFAGPMFKKSLAARTERIQKELDAGKRAQEAAAEEVARIRAGKGDISADKARLLAEADQQAASLLEDGRARLVAEVADLQAKADADIAAIGARQSDDLRAEIARLSSSATDSLVTDSLDAATHNDLIEAFIAKVGAAK